MKEEWVVKWIDTDSNTAQYFYENPKIRGWSYHQRDATRFTEAEARREAKVLADGAHVKRLVCYAERLKREVARLREEFESDLAERLGVTGKTWEEMMLDVDELMR